MRGAAAASSLRDSVTSGTVSTELTELAESTELAKLAELAESAAPKIRPRVRRGDDGNTFAAVRAPAADPRDTPRESLDVSSSSSSGTAPSRDTPHPDAAVIPVLGLAATSTDLQRYS